MCVAKFRSVPYNDDGSIPFYLVQFSSSWNPSKAVLGLDKEEKANLVGLEKMCAISSAET